MKYLLNYTNFDKIKLDITLFFIKQLQLVSFFLYNTIKKFFNFLIIRNDQIHIYLDKNNILDICFFLKNSIFFSCKQLLDFTLVDRLEQMKKSVNRWEYIYVLLSIKYNIRILIRGYLKFYENLNSLISLYSSANWLEREVWDMFGVYIKNHNDLRRILTDYHFLGSPLRKDFPLTGYVEVRYDEEIKNVVVNNLELSQELREFRLEILEKIMQYKSEIKNITLNFGPQHPAAHVFWD